MIYGLICYARTNNGNFLGDSESNHERIPSDMDFENAQNIHEDTAGGKPLSFFENSLSDSVISLLSAIRKR